MLWEKRGVIFKAEGQFEWMAHHACGPIAEKISDRVIRIYFSPRDSRGQSRVTFIEVDADNPANVLYVHDKVVLDLGKQGCFDDSGVMSSSIIDWHGKKYLLYIGWNRGISVPYRNAIGIAASDDGGLSFNRMFDGPILDRTPAEPYFCASPYAIIDDGLWKLWYASGTGWAIVDGMPEPLYQIKYATSLDGISWRRDNITCIEYKSEGEANARPCVIKENGLYRMWYCFRGSLKYRTETSQSYRLGYAESGDGENWRRKDEDVGIERSEQGWDSAMLEYPFVYEHRRRKYLLYNGNGFGETGFGFAVMTSNAEPV